MIRWAPRIRPLRNPIQTYAWGSRTAIAELLGMGSPAPEPQAELWMGAHPSAPSRVVTSEGEVLLGDWIARDPRAVLGSRVARDFGGSLPFLFKVLAVERPLSIQAHPNREQARAGFARENAAGIPLDASHRGYKDENHKPELICALTSFQALLGFRPIPQISRLLGEISAPEVAGALDALHRKPDGDGLAHLFRSLMALDPELQRSVVERAAARARGRLEEGAAWGWVARLAESYPRDIGVLTPLLLNLVELAPGEAVFLPAGALHCYLGGMGVELMANSDNVLRGGLTPKHVNVPELLEVLSFQAGEVELLHPRSVRPSEELYDAPAAEFALSVLRVREGTPYESAGEHGVETLLCTSGAGRIVDRTNDDVTTFVRGDAFIVPAVVRAYVIEGQGTLYKAAAPL